MRRNTFIFSQNLISATSCKKSRYMLVMFYLIHISWTNLSEEGLPTEYYSPSLNNIQSENECKICTIVRPKGDVLNLTSRISLACIITLSTTARGTSQVFKVPLKTVAFGAVRV